MKLIYSLLLLGILILPLVSCIWVPVEGALRSVSVGPSGVWGANEGYNIYYRKGTYNNVNSSGSDWVQTDGKLKQVDVGKDEVWGVNSIGNIYYRVGISKITPTGKYWQQVSGNLKHVSVSNNGHVWGVNTNDYIYVLNNRNNDSPWKQISGALKQISVGESGVWGVNSANSIYYRNGTYGDKGDHGTKWIKVSGSLKYVSSGKNIVIGTNINDDIYIRRGASAQNPAGTFWEKISGKLVVVDGFDAFLYWGVNKNDKIYHTLV